MFKLTAELRACEQPYLDEIAKQFADYRDESRKYIGHAKNDDEQAQQRSKVAVLSRLVELTEAVIQEKRGTR